MISEMVVGGLGWVVGFFLPLIHWIPSLKLTTRIRPSPFNAGFWALEKT